MRELDFILAYTDSYMDETTLQAMVEPTPLNLALCLERNGESEAAKQAFLAIASPHSLEGVIASVWAMADDLVAFNDVEYHKLIQEIGDCPECLVYCNLFFYSIRLEAAHHDSQRNVLDSIKEMIQPLPNASRMYYATWLAMLYRKNEHDEIEYLDLVLQACELANEQGATVLYSLLCYRAGYGYSQLRRRRKAIEWAERSLQSESFSLLSSRQQFDAHLLLLKNAIYLEYFDLAFDTIDRLEQESYQDSLVYQEQIARLESMRADLCMRTGTHLGQVASMLKHCEDIYYRNKEHFHYQRFDIKLHRIFGDFDVLQGEHLAAMHHYRMVLQSPNVNMWDKKMIYERLLIAYEALADYAKCKHCYEKAMEIEEEIHEYSLEINRHVQIQQLPSILEQLSSSVVAEQWEHDDVEALHREEFMNVYMEYANQVENQMKMLRCELPHFDEHEQEHGKKATRNLLQAVTATLSDQLPNQNSRLFPLQGHQFVIMLNYVDDSERLDYMKRVKEVWSQNQYAQQLDLVLIKEQLEK
ncbi:MAG: diguanylate cyclase domain-containing protein [Erysipelotrichaceae bacterium]